MKGRTEVPELDEAIAAHGRALESGGLDAACAFVSDAARDSYRTAMAEVLRAGPLAGFEPAAKARIGFQYISKVRFSRNGKSVVLLNRWRNEDGAWRIAEVEDLSNKRSSWSGIEIPSALRTRNGHA